MAQILRERNHEVWLFLSDRFPETIEPLRSLFRDWVSDDNHAIFTSINGVAASNPENQCRLSV
jgi:hypothetical protein